jgi:hypothetical protein
MKAPFDDPEWTIWGFSRGMYTKFPRFDLWFELHDPKLFNSYEKNFPGYVGWLTKQHRVTRPMFPWAEIKERFGTQFFTGGQAPYMFAYAIMQEPHAIAIHGMSAAGPYKPQRYELQHFAGLAHDLGIEVTAPHSDILEPNKLYSFS